MNIASRSIFATRLNLTCSPHIFLHIHQKIKHFFLYGLDIERARHYFEYQLYCKTSKIYYQSSYYIHACLYLYITFLP